MWVALILMAILVIANIAAGSDVLGLWNWVLLAGAFIFFGWAFTMQVTPSQGTSAQHRSSTQSRWRAIVVFGMIVLGILLYALFTR